MSESTIFGILFFGGMISMYIGLWIGTNTIPVKFGVTGFSMIMLAIFFVGLSSFKTDEDKKK